MHNPKITSLIISISCLESMSRYCHYYCFCHTLCPIICHLSLDIAYVMINGILCNQNLSKTNKKRIYSTIIKIIFASSIEIWKIKAKIGEMLVVTKMVIEKGFYKDRQLLIMGFTMVSKLCMVMYAVC